MPHRSLLPTSRGWWFSLLLIVIVAGALYFSGYRVSLPYVDHPDEPSFNLAAQMIIDSGTAKPMGYNAYPPGIISLNYLVLKALNETVRHPASDFIPVVRLITVTAALLSVVVVAFLGVELAGEFAGLLAALIWMVNPIWNISVRFATADPFVTFFALLALWLVCIGTNRNRESLNTASSYALMLAIAFKTQAIFLMPLIFCLPLIRWWGSDAAPRQSILRAALWNALRWGIFFFWLLALYPTLDANKIVQWVAPTDKLALPTPQLLATHLDITLLATRSVLAWLAVVVVIAVACWRGEKSLSRITLLAVIIAFGLFLFGISLFGLQSSRQMYFLLALGDLLSGTTIALVLGWVIQWLAGRRSQPSYALKLAYAAVIAYTFIAILPAAAASLNTTLDALKPDRRNDLATYMDTSLPPAPHIASSENHKTLNRDYGGYHGINDFPLVANANLTGKTLDEWRAQNVVYAIVPYDTAWQDYTPDQILLLKSYPTDSRFRGPAMNVLRLQPIQTRLETPLSLGTIQLVGYDLASAEITAGSEVTITYYWQADAPTHVPYRVFTHLYPVDAVEVVAQRDGLPLADDLERRPSSTWDDPNETLVSRPFTLMIPASTTAGRYRLALGFYDPVGSQRLTTADGETFITVTEIEVLPSP